MNRPLSIGIGLFAMLTVGFAQPAQAQKTPKPIDPTVEVRLRSINDMLGVVPYLGDLVGQGEAAKQGAEFVRTITDEKKGIEGIDPKKPFGMYATVTQDVVGSQLIVMIPLADESAFLDLLTGKLNLNPKKGDEGRYEVMVPNVPVPVYFRFTKGYVYITAVNETNLNDKRLIAPNDFFAAKQTALAAIDLHVERIPADIKKTVFAQLELKLNDVKNTKVEGEDPVQTQSKIFGAEATAQLIQVVLEEGKKLSLNLSVEPKTDDVTLDVQFAGVNGSSLAKRFQGMKGASIVPANTEKGAAALVTSNMALPESVQKSFNKVVDVIVKEVKTKSSERDKVLNELALKGIAPTLRAGKLETAFYASPRDAKGKGDLYAAFTVVDGKGIEETIKKMVKHDDPKEIAEFTFDVKKVGDMNFHTVTLKKKDEIKSLGSDTIWLGLSDTRAVVQVTQDGKLNEALLKTASKPGSKPLHAELSFATMALLGEKEVPKAKVREIIDEVFGKTGYAGRDTISLTIDGGEQLTTRLNMKGKAFKMIAMIGQETKK